jgi:hypothetical protein
MRHPWERIYMHTEYWCWGRKKNQRERDHLLDLSIDGVMIFTLDCKETVLKLWTGFSWFGVGIGDYLWTI